MTETQNKLEELINVLLRGLPTAEEIRKVIALAYEAGQIDAAQEFINRQRQGTTGVPS